MIKTQTHRTKLFGSPTSLGRSFIEAATITLNGEALPAWVDLNAAPGTVSRNDGIDDYTLYEFCFEYFAPSRVDCSISPLSIPADGATEATLSVSCEDATLTSVTIAVLKNAEIIGTIDIALIDGGGTEQITSEVAGSYQYVADLRILNTTWSRSEYFRGNTATLEVTDNA